jgi:putative endonuclease
VGLINDLTRRVYEHKHGQVDGYTREHGCDQLVWYERHAYADQAIKGEKRIKRWLREWTFALLEEANPQRRDLFGELPPVRPAQP